MKSLYLLLSLASCHALFADEPYQSTFLTLLQDYCPSFYLKWMCHGNLEEDDVYHAAYNGRTHFLQAAKDYYKERNKLAIFKEKLDKENPIAKKFPLQAAMERNRLTTAEFLLDQGVEIHEEKTDLIANLINPTLLALNNSRAPEHFFKVGLLLHYKPTLSDKVFRHIEVLNQDVRSELFQYLAKTKNPSLQPYLKEKIKSLYFISRMVTEKGLLADNVLQIALQEKKESIVFHFPYCKMLKKTILSEEQSAWLIPLALKRLKEVRDMKKNLEGETSVLISLNERFPEKEIGKEEVMAAIKAQDKKMVQLLLTINESLKQVVQEHILADYETMYALMPMYHRMQKRMARLSLNEIKIVKNKNVGDKRVQQLQAFYEQMKKSMLERSDGKHALHTYLTSKELFEQVKSADLLRHLQSSIVQQAKYVEMHKDNHEACCVCLDNYKENQPFVTMCANEHHVCVSCFNAPSVESCPQCRQELWIDKLTQCQGCLQIHNTRFVHCLDCDVTSISCNRCFHFACCKKSIPITDATWELQNNIKVQDIVLKYREHIDQKGMNAISQNEINTIQAKEAIKQQADQMLDRINNSTLVIVKKLESIKEDLKQKEQSYANEPAMALFFKEEHARLMRERDKCINKINYYSDLFNDIKKVANTKIDTLINEYHIKNHQIVLQMDARKRQLQSMAPVVTHDEY